MRICLTSLLLVAGCQFDGGVSGSAGFDADPAAVDASASQGDAAPDSADAGQGAPDAEQANSSDAAPDLIYSLVPTGNLTVVANFGGPGGGNFDEECPAGRVVTGFDGDNQDSAVCRVQSVCSLLTANPDGTVVTSDPVLGPLHGNSGSFYPESPLICPANEVVVAAAGHVSASDLVRRLAFSCASLSWDYESLTYTVGAPAAIPGDIGYTTGTAFSGACAANQVASGFGGNAGTLLDRFELHCSSLTPVAQ